MSAASFPKLRLESGHFPADELQVYRMQGSESISRLFWFDVDVASSEPDALDPGAVAGADACLVFEREGNEVRRVFGMIASCEETFDIDGERMSSYRLRLVPRAHRLTLVHLQDIYMGVTVPGLIESKLRALGLGNRDADVSGQLMSKYPERDFVVQFDETDLAFVSRLTEHLGISFLFDHQGGADRLVFTDHNGGFPASDHESLTLHDRQDECGVRELRATTTVIPETYIVMDYNYRTPDVELTASHTSSLGWAGGVVEWGGHFKTQVEGDDLAKIRAEEKAVGQRVLRGRSDIAELSAGFRHRLQGHARLDDVEVLVTSVEHTCTQPALAHGGDGTSSYENTFTAMPTDRTFRPARITPRPRIAGLVTGIVEPRDLNEVERYALLDTEGRYRIKFLYDSAGLDDRPAMSRPVRKAEPTVGPDYGMHFPLRPGVEVLMAFVNGDPDRPIIVGAVHNTRTPAHVMDKVSRTNTIKTASGIRMRFKDD